MENSQNPAENTRTKKQHAQTHAPVDGHTIEELRELDLERLIQIANSMDIENPQLIVFTSIEDAYSGNHSFTKMVDFDRNTNSYVYINYQYQNRLEKIEEVDKYFKISEYNQKVLDTFGTDNLKWEI